MQTLRYKHPERPRLPRRQLIRKIVVNAIGLVVTGGIMVIIGAFAVTSGWAVLVRGESGAAKEFVYASVALAPFLLLVISGVVELCHLWPLLRRSSRDEGEECAHSVDAHG